MWMPTWQCLGLIFLIVAAFFIGFFVNAYHFLAVTSRLPNPDVLIIEDWMPESVLQAAAEEFEKGSYHHLLISGFDISGNDHPLHNQIKSTASQRIIALGVPENQIIECFVKSPDISRSLAMARSANDTLQKRNIESMGVTVMAPSVHARKTRMVYRRAMLSGTPVGVIAVPTGHHNSSGWWMSSPTAKAVIISYAGLIYEWVTGF